MISVQVTDIAVFMKYFLSTDTFDFLKAVEITISTYCDFNISGRHNKKYFDNDLVPESEFTTWGKLRPICHELIKGKNLPLKMNFVLLLPADMTSRLLSENGSNLTSDQIDFLINVRYENNQVTLINGSNMKSFIPDKSYEEIWDNAFSKEISRYNF